MLSELSDNCYFVGLGDYSTLGKELQQINEDLAGNPDRNVIIDFSRVNMLTSSNISNLMILNDMLQKKGYRLILCNVSFQIKCEFTVCGLRDVFKFAGDKFEAMESLAKVG